MLAKRIYALSLTLIWSASILALEIDSHPKLLQVADQLIAENYYSQQQLTEIFKDVKIQQSVLDAMQSPAEYKFTWGKYRKLFLQDDRIQQGVEFWQTYAADLDRAEREFGVPASIIVAIIGVESKFGKYKGKHKVLDSLVTLVVGFERRSKFFARELKEFLILSKENSLAADQIMGSYAGAVGFPQFISSSYRAYAIDFSGDGKTDLIDQPVDAIGSIANYFVEHGWMAGKPVTSVAHERVPREVSAMASNKRKVQYAAVDLRKLGAPLRSDIDDAEKLGVLELNASELVPDEQDRKTYIVRAGDTACEIAEAHNVKCKSLFNRNKLKKSGAIYRGQKLIIPSGPGTQLRPDIVAKANSNAAKADSKWAVSSDKTISGTSSQKQDTPELLRYFFTHKNFYVITRYNQSVLYAMAVNDLSEAMAEARRATLNLSLVNKL